MATLMDIAAALDLNKTTVSKALNNSSDISRETKERVLAEAERIGYVKHRRKRVQSDQNALIGIICPEIVSYYYAQLVTSLNACLQKKGFTTLVLLSAFSPEMEKRHLEQLIKLNVSGIIMITEQTNVAPTIHSVPGAKNIPTVIMGLNYESREHDVISVDEEYGIRSIVEHLVSKGHQRFAFLGDDLVGNRLKYLRRYLEQKGIELKDEYVVLSDKRNGECGYECMQRLLALDPRPTAVLTGYDTIALGAYRAITEHGLRIPEDIALTGFDDADFCEFLPQSLTSVNCDPEAQCRVAAAILLSRIHEPGEKFTQVAAITPRLMVRESTAGRD